MYEPRYPQMDEEVTVYTMGNDPVEGTFVGRVVGIREERFGEPTYTIKVPTKDLPTALDSRYPGGYFVRGWNDVIVTD